jgi:pepF/M3 family oligoendopeptidase
MLSAMKEAFPDFRRYLKAKARLLGKERLAWWDKGAPVGRAGHTYTYDEARRFLLEQFATFSPRLTEMTERAYNNNWIDAEPRDGKSGGAFCMGVLGLDESRVLCNYDGSLDSVTTLAHELGHAYHNDNHKGLTPLQREDPMTLAETASIMNQTIITNAALAQAEGDAQTELAILEAFLADATGVVVDIYSRFLFESQVFERRAEAELSADELCELMLACQKEAYGDGLDHDFLHPYMWAWKPHYYIPGLSFYNFPYAFGLLFGLGLYTVYQERGPAFVADYEAFLRSTGSEKPAPLAARFGIDLRDQAFWRGSLDLIRGYIDRFEAAAAAA